ncbi:MAG: MBL fold metallo-hydrolase [Candidatus Helarchaeales archaeon]
MKLKWLGTAGFELSLDESTILIDPFISRTPGNRPDVPKSKFQFKKVNHVFLTHGHFDHAYDVREILQDTGATLYCSVQVKDALLEHGVPQSQIISLEGSEKMDFPDYSVDVIKSVHTKFGAKVILSKLLNPLTYKGIRRILRMAKNFPKGQVLGYFFTIKKEKFTIMHFGSGGYREENLKPYDGLVDIFLAPYAGRYDMHEIIPKMASLFHPKVLIPHHYDDAFPPLSWFLSIEKLKNEMQKALPDVKLFTPEILEEIQIDSFDEFYKKLE